MSLEPSTGEPGDADAARLADRATELAVAWLAGASAEIAAMAAHDPRLLYRAAQLVRARLPARVARPAATAEHLAFTVIVAANERLRMRRPGARDWRPSPGSTSRKGW